jgi:PAS domain S-box-containing protein
MNRDENSFAAILKECQLLRALIDHLPDFVYIKDLQSRFVLNNLAHVRVLGATRQEEVIGKTDADCFPPEMASQYLADEQPVLRSGQTLNRQEPVLDPATGDIRWLQTTKVPLRNDAGEIVGLVGINRDITARKQAEEALRQARDELERRVVERTAELTRTNASLVEQIAERQRTEQALAEERRILRTLIDSLPDLIFVKDAESRFLLLNLACARQLGADRPEDALGKTDADFVAAELARQYRADEIALMESGQSVNQEERTQHRETGDLGWSHTIKVLLKDEAGNVVGLVGVARDISPKKRADEKLEALHKQMLALARQAGMAETATSVLHNVGNVLNSVNVSATMLRDGIQKSKIASLAKLTALLNEHTADLGQFLTTDPRGQQVPDYLHQLTDRLAAEQAGWIKEVETLYLNIEHINKIIALQQTYAGVAGIVETVSLAELVDDALRIHEQAYVRHVVRVVRDYTPVQSISVDKHKVLQIVVNLLHNAKYACDAGARSDKVVTVRIGPAGPDRVRIEVADNGVGIDPEYLTRIFALGYTTRKGGHGFGLHSGAIAAKEMGGVLTAHSAGPGQGASFVLELPLHPPAAHSAADERQ